MAADWKRGRAGTFSKRERMVLSIASLSAGTVLKGILHTCRSKIECREYFDEAIIVSGRVLVAFWHETLCLAAWHYRQTGYRTLTSQSFDGELAARVVEQFGLKALRGSSSRGGREALVALRQALDDGHTVGFTLDGPKGPRRIAKPGIAILAAKCHVPIIPHAMAVSPAWRLGSWDRMYVPRLFGTVVSRFGTPIPPPESMTSESIEDTRIAIEESLNSLQYALEADLGTTL